MKKLILLSFAIVLCSVVYAQQSGQLVLGSGLHFENTTNENAASKFIERDFALNVQPGLMITNQIAVGITVEFRSNSQKIKYKVPPLTGESKSSQNTFLLGLYGRYHGRFTDKIQFTGQLGFGKEFYLKGTAPHPNVYEGNLTAGLLYFVAKKVALGMDVVSLNFSSYNDKTNEIKNSNLSLDYNIVNPFFRVLFYI